MADPAKTTPATVRYEIRIISGPQRIILRGKRFDLGRGQDMPCLVRMILSGRQILDETIVGIIGDEQEVGSANFLDLRKFLSDGGVIGLHRDLAF
jgi:hypothetical protein